MKKFVLKNEKKVKKFLIGIQLIGRMFINPDYNPVTKRKVLIVFDDVIAGMSNNKKFHRSN